MIVKMLEVSTLKSLFISGIVICCRPINDFFLDTELSEDDQNHIVDHIQKCTGFSGLKFSPQLFEVYTGVSLSYWFK